MAVIIRKTRSVCPVCICEIEADIVMRDNRIYMDKRCGEHGDFNLLISRHPEYYKGLSEFYFPLMKESCLQRDYIVHLTNDCDLNCPICLANANSRKIENYPLEKLEKFLKGKRRYKIDLMGAEPAMREDLALIIRVVKKSGNIAALHTNGIKISDFSYLSGLKKAGLAEVHLQFDGFDDSVYEKIRGKKLVDIKMKTLDNLKKLNLSTDLVVTIVRGINEQEIVKVLDFGVNNKFVKEIFFLGCRFLGKAKDLPKERCMMPDELIDILEEQTNGKISRENIFKFQKLYFALLSAFSIRKCFYIHHFLVARDKGNYIPINEIFDLNRIQAKLEKYKNLKIKNSGQAVPYLLLFLFLNLMKFKAFFWLRELLSFSLPFVRGFALSRLSRKSVLLGFISACDAFSLDYEIAKNCGKGAISNEFGIQDIGALDNVRRDNLAKGKES